MVDLSMSAQLGWLSTLVKLSEASVKDSVLDTVRRNVLFYEYKVRFRGGHRFADDPRVAFSDLQNVIFHCELLQYPAALRNCREAPALSGHIAPQPCRKRVASDAPVPLLGRVQFEGD